jgi:hypothetical protein
MLGSSEGKKERDRGGDRANVAERTYVIHESISSCFWCSFMIDLAILISVVFVDRDMIEQDRQPDRGPVDVAGSSNTRAGRTRTYTWT